MYSLVSLLSGIYPLPAMHSLLVTFYVTEYPDLDTLIIPIKRRILNLDKSVIKYLPRCTYHLLYCVKGLTQVYRQLTCLFVQLVCMSGYDIIQI